MPTRSSSGPRKRQRSTSRVPPTNSDSSSLILEPSTRPVRFFGFSDLFKRSVTILILAPLILYLTMSSKWSCMWVLYLCMFIGSLEWSGLKRHLKVSLLLWHADSSFKNIPTTHTEIKKDKKENNQETYLVPITSISLYNILKHGAWALLVVAAYKGEVAYLAMLASYLVILVLVTVVAHNRLELRVEQAINLSFLLSQSLGDNGNANDKEKQNARNNWFISEELRMIAEKQPVEQFLDFSLDLFGMIWVSGIAYPLLLYSVQGVGTPWGASVLLGNFANDIMALIVGKSLKVLKKRHYDKRSNGKHEIGLIESMPHPLYPAISPNKSTEGAIAGVLANALTFALTLSSIYANSTQLPPIDPTYLSFPVLFMIGMFFGVVGVIGDLLQSLLKRSANVKDAGCIIPGHGGILDRIDGLLVTFPAMYGVVSTLIALS